MYDMKRKMKSNEILASSDNENSDTCDKIQRIYRKRPLLTCLTCNMKFSSIPLHREHYTTEYHRYNLNRKTAGLSVLTLEEYEIKEECHRMWKAKKDTKLIFHCTLCQKKYNNENQYKNHLTSIKHKNNMKITYTDLECQSCSSNLSEADIYLHIIYSPNNLYKNKEEKNTETDSKEITPIQCVDSNRYNCCLFCSFCGKTVYHTLSHMKMAHSFVIPDKGYVINQKRLLLHLSMKIWDKNLCLWCNNSGKKFRSGEAVRSHMIDKGHCMMRFEGNARKEYMPFYDYSITKASKQAHVRRIPSEKESSDYQEESGSNGKISDPISPYKVCKVLPRKLPIWTIDQGNTARTMVCNTKSGLKRIMNLFQIFVDVKHYLETNDFFVMSKYLSLLTEDEQIDESVLFQIFADIDHYLETNDFSIIIKYLNTLMGDEQIDESSESNDSSSSKPDELSNVDQELFYLVDELSDLDDELFDSDEELSDPNVLDYEMVLPSGKKIGHRSLIRYYKQYIKAEAVALKEKRPRDFASKMRSMFLKTRSLGKKSETIIASENKKRRDIQHEQRIHAKYSTQLQFKQNKLQQHFRSQSNI